MLYAVVMTVIFGMILSFYLSAVVNNQKNLRHQKEFLSAQIMARMTRDRGAAKHQLPWFDLTWVLLSMNKLKTTLK